MAKHYNSFSSEVAHALLRGAVGILPTDTLYGLVASATEPAAVDRVYHLKGRNADKPCIILVPDEAAILQFGVSANEIHRVSGYWPGALSVVFSSINKKYEYLIRDGKLPPFRIPDNKALRHFLQESGPIIAPSANEQGKQPVSTADAAERVFGDTVDFYIDGGTLQGYPSTVVRLTAGRLEVIRQGAVDITA